MAQRYKKFSYQATFCANIVTVFEWCITKMSMKFQIFVSVFTKIRVLFISKHKHKIIN